MDLLLLAERENVLLGQDFLTWLWYKTETENGEFTSSEGLHYTLFMDQKIAVEGGEGETLETATVSGPGGEMSEARTGLRTGKKVTKALLSFELDGDPYQMTLSAKDFGITGFKTPKIDKADQDDDPDGLFLEKIYMLERCLTLLDEVFVKFIKLRVTEEWKDEVAKFRHWLRSED